MSSSEEFYYENARQPISRDNTLAQEITALKMKIMNVPLNSINSNLQHKFDLLTLVESCATKVTNVESDLKKIVQKINEYDEKHIASGKKTKEAPFSESFEVEIRNVPQVANENLLDVITNVASAFNYTLQPIHINDIRRINNDIKTSTPKNIVVNFSSQIKRDEFIEANKRFRDINGASDVGISSFKLGSSLNKRIVVSKNLSRKKMLLYMIVRKMAEIEGFKNVWVKNNNIYCRKTNISDVILIEDYEDLKKMEVANINHVNLDSQPETVTVSKEITTDKKKLTKDNIGPPTDFRHISHVGWDGNAGFVVNLTTEDTTLIDEFGQMGTVTAVNKLVDSQDNTNLMNETEPIYENDTADTEISTKTMQSLPPPPPRPPSKLPVVAIAEQFEIVEPPPIPAIRRSIEPPKVPMPLVESRENSMRKKSKNKKKLTQNEIGLPSNLEIDELYHCLSDIDLKLKDSNTRSLIYDFINKRSSEDMTKENQDQCIKFENLTDEELRQFFNMVGISQRQLKDKNSRKFIYEFIMNHGGSEAVKETLKGNMK